jgi:hypothetical protein
VIRHPGCLRSVRLALALLLALPWSDALTAASAAESKPLESSSRTGDGWRRDPDSSPAQVLSASWEDIDDADDARGDRPQAVAEWRGQCDDLLAAQGDRPGFGEGREAADSCRLKSFRRLRC